MFQDFIAKIKGMGLATPNRFRIIISPPKTNLGQVDVTIGGQPTVANLVTSALGSGVDGRSLNLLCESTVLPGRSILTTERNIYGPSYKMPYGQVYSEWPVMFNVDNTMYPKTLFDQWHDLVIDPNTFDVNFYKNYVTDIEVQQLDKQNNIIYAVQLIEAYPVTVNDLDLNHGAVDQVHKLSVSFAFRLWKPI